jgi:hypothetical protein
MLRGQDKSIAERLLDRPHSRTMTTEGVEFKLHLP